jgi:hypothetical protein
MTPSMPGAEPIGSHGPSPAREGTRSVKLRVHSLVVKIKDSRLYPVTARGLNTM